MPSRDDVLIQRNAISSQDLKRLMQHVHQARQTDSLVSNFDETVEAEWVVNRSIRDTQEVDLPDTIRQLLTRIDDECIRAFINPFYGVAVADREPSQILHYGVGGHYIPHVDAETLYTDEDGIELWEKTLDRDLSLVYFLNDDFEGGELFFPALDLVIEPVVGMLVCFPSDHNFIHGVRAVTAGHRYTIVTWAKVDGTPSMDDINQSTMDEYHRLRPKPIEQPSRLARKAGTTR
jgi:predicted 2-oxoglutarate/Fe(II)-dependent dioxygenase YbiX